MCMTDLEVNMSQFKNSQQSKYITKSILCIYIYVLCTSDFGAEKHQ